MSPGSRLSDKVGNVLTSAGTRDRTMWPAVGWIQFDAERVGVPSFLPATHRGIEARNATLIGRQPVLAEVPSIRARRRAQTRL